MLSKKLLEASKKCPGYLVTIKPGKWEKITKKMAKNLRPSISAIKEVEWVTLLNFEKTFQTY